MLLNHPRNFDKRTPLEASILTLRAMEKVVTEGTSRSAQMPGRKIYGKYEIRAKNTQTGFQGKKRSAAIISENLPVLKFIGGIPWVKMVAITGSLAAYNPEKDSDIDMMIITKQNRVWITRGFCCPDSENTAQTSGARRGARKFLHKSFHRRISHAVGKRKKKLIYRI